MAIPRICASSKTLSECFGRNCGRTGGEAAAFRRRTRSWRFSPAVRDYGDFTLFDSSDRAPRIPGVDERAACLSILDGELLVEVGDFGQTPRGGETLRYRCDRPHRIRNLSSAPAHATMVCILKAAAME
jgi:hypothetical protein